MHDSVRSSFVRFSTPFEGALPYLYADVRGLVTIAIGVLVDPVQMALTLPLRRPDGTPATQAQIRDAWHAVKSDLRAAKEGHRRAAALPANNLRLSAADVESITLRKLDANERLIAPRYARWPEWPADAQLAVHSLAWAVGPHYPSKFPRCHGHLLREDFASAAKEISINTTPRRNAANIRLLESAARLVTAEQSARAVLHGWP